MKSHKLDAAEAYLARGWQLFTVRENKRPWGNCAQCAPGAHDGDSCDHLMCHGHQAATTDMSRLEKMFVNEPAANLALRCGAGSGVVVVDAEGTDRVKCGRIGVDILEDWDWWGDTLKAVTGSGGLHLFYAYDPAAGRITARNRVAPNIDIKGEGGYVVLSPAEGRTWLNWSQREGLPAAPSADLLSWMISTKGGAGGSGSGSGTGLKNRLVDGRVPAGERYEFTRDLVYKLRKQGATREEALNVCAAWYERYDQPPVAETELPWRQVEYELDRVWARVEPEKVDPRQLAWARQLREQG